jgi:phosphoribosylaminoimidazole-succinocarboxamide synthase
MTFKWGCDGFQGYAVCSISSNNFRHINHPDIPAHLYKRSAKIQGLPLHHKGDFKGIFSCRALPYKGFTNLPSKENLLFFKHCEHIPYRYIFFNIIATAVWSTGVFSALYAGYLNPEVRVTSSQLSPVINGVATIIFLIFIDPYFSL